MTENRNMPTGAVAGTERSSGLEVAPDVRRPDEHIRRPHLRVKRRDGQPAATRPEQRAPQARAEAPEPPAPAHEPASPAEPAPATQTAEAAEPHAAGGPARQIPPPAGDDDPRFRYATYRTAPPDEPAPKLRWLAGLVMREETGEVSTGFVLGAALILVVLVGGIWVARLSNKVGRLEQRLVQLEQGSTMTADAEGLLP